MKSTYFSIKQGNLKLNNIEIKDISFKLKTGDCFFFQAPNASGKTTLFKYIFKYKNLCKNFYFKECFIKKNQQIYNYKDLKTEDFAELGMFFSFQQPIVIEELKTRDFLYLVFKHAKQNINFSDQQLKTKFNNIINIFFDLYKLNKNLLDKGLNVGFSGGEHKKIELLQGMLIDAKLWFLDEIETGLDESSREQIIQFISNNIEKYGFFIITHNQTFIKKLAKKIKDEKKTLKIFTIQNNTFKLKP